MKSRVRRLVLVLPCLAAIVTIAAIALPAVGFLLVVADPLVTSDAIFVLEGWTPARELEAAVLYHRGLAPIVVLTHPHDPTGEIVRAVGGDVPPQEHAARVLRHVGVPETAIVRLTDVADNTERELAIDFGFAHARGFRRVIFVTSPSHTRRVSIIWRSRYGDRIQGRVDPTAWERFPAERWWRSRRTLEETLHELFGIVNFELGSPLRTFDRGE